jgi:hypothetical protein
VQYRLNPAGPWLNFGSPISARTAIVTGLVASTAYDFQLVLLNSLLLSATSSTLSAVSTLSGGGGGAPVWNATDLSGMAVSGTNNVTASSTTPSPSGIRSVASHAVSSGKFYAEMTATSANRNEHVGLANLSWPEGATPLGNDSNSIGWDFGGPVLTNNALEGGSIPSYSAGDVLCIAVDTAGKIFFRVNNGGWDGFGSSDNPSTNVGGYAFTITGPLFLAFSARSVGHEVGPQQNTGATQPVVSGPTSLVGVLSQVLDTPDFFISDTHQPLAGNCTVHLTCTTGTISVSGSAGITGNNTNNVTVVDTFDNCAAVLNSIGYTAPAAVGTDSLHVQFTQQSGLSNTLIVPVSNVANDPSIKTLNVAGPFAQAVPTGYNAWGSGAGTGVAPNAPTGLLASGVTGSSANLSWTASTSGTAPISYQPQYRAHPSTTWLNAGSAVTGTTATVSGLASNTTYDFQIVAQNSAGQTASSLVTATTLTVTVPGDTTGMQANRIGDFMDRMGFNLYPMIGGSNLFGASGDYTLAGVEATYRWLLGPSGHKFTNRAWYSSSALTIYQNWSASQFFNDMGGGPWSLALVNGADVSQVTMQPLIAASSTTNGWLRWVEGCNEPNFNVTVSVCLAAQQAIKTATNASASAAFPVLSLGAPVAITAVPPEPVYTGYFGGSLAAQIAASDQMAVHDYPPFNPDFNDVSNRGSWSIDVFQANQIAYGPLPQVITEWQPTLYNNQGHNGDDNYDCYYLPIFALSKFRLGYLAWCWWPLYDGYGFTCGMFVSKSTDGRPSAYTLRAMCQLCPDAGPTRKTFSPGKLDVTVTGLPGPVSGSPNSGGQLDLFQASGGVYYLYVRNSQQDPGGAANPVTVTFNSHAMTKVEQFIVSRNVNNGTDPMTLLASQTGVSTFAMNVANEVHLLRITY